MSSRRKFTEMQQRWSRRCQCRKTLGRRGGIERDELTLVNLDDILPNDPSSSDIQMPNHPNHQPSSSSLAQPSPQPDRPLTQPLNSPSTHPSTQQPTHEPRARQSGACHGWCPWRWSYRGVRRYRIRWLIDPNRRGRCE